MVKRNLSRCARAVTALAWRAPESSASLRAGPSVQRGSTLDVLLTERNVTRAGERLFLSQPAVTGILARLRHAFQDERARPNVADRLQRATSLALAHRGHRIECADSCYSYSRFEVALRRALAFGL